MNIVRKKQRTPPLRVVLFGPAESWKTSSLNCIGDRALWLDFHGSTATLSEQPNSLFDPTKPSARPELLSDLEDDLKRVAEDKKLREEFDWIIFDGLDDIERLYLVPEALRRAGTSGLGEAYGKAYDCLVTLHGDFLRTVEALWLAGYNIGMTCHEQRIERVSAEGANFMVVEMKLAYQAGKVGKWDAPSIWRDWVDVCAYLTTEGRKVVKGEKDRIGKARGDVDQHVVYLGGEAWLDSAKARRCESLESPMKISSPLDFWERLTSTWQRSFMRDEELEKLRAEVRAIAESLGAPAAAFKAIAKAADKGALEKQAAQVKAWAENQQKGE